MIYERETDFFIRTDLTPVASRQSVRRELELRLYHGELKFTDLRPNMREIYRDLAVIKPLGCVHDKELPCAVCVAGRKAFSEKLRLCMDYAVPYAIKDDFKFSPNPANLIILDWPKDIPDEVKQRLSA
jgi:hypothetical protein